MSDRQMNERQEPAERCTIGCFGASLERDDCLLEDLLDAETGERQY